MPTGTVATRLCAAPCRARRPTPVAMEASHRMTPARARTRMTARQTAIAEIATHRVAKTQDYLEDAGADIYGQYVFDEGAQRQYLAKPIFRKLRRTIDGPRAVRPGDRRRGRARREGVGAGARRDPLHPLVRADDRLDGREARLVPDPDRRRPDDRRVLRPEPASRASRTRARSRRAASAPRSRPAATPPGTSPARSSSRSSRTASR